MGSRSLWAHSRARTHVYWNDRDLGALTMLHQRYGDRVTRVLFVFKIASEIKWISIDFFQNRNELRRQLVS